MRQNMNGDIEEITQLLKLHKALPRLQKNEKLETNKDKTKRNIWKKG